MPQGFSPTAANRQPIYVGDSTFLNTYGTHTGPVVGPAANGAATLVAANSGSLNVFSTLTGDLFTLPTPAPGLQFNFFVAIANTSGAHKVITSGAAIYLLGAIVQNTVAATPAANDGPKTFTFNGTTHVAISMNGTTTGGLPGTSFSIRYYSATQWLIEGLVVASGIIATPAATS